MKGGKLKRWEDRKGKREKYSLTQMGLTGKRSKVLKNRTEQSKKKEW